MNQERVKRKLSAILSADAAGYSRLMGEDEVLTVRTLEAYRAVMSDLIEQFRGRVVDSPGDNLLAEFSSVVDAVQCAVEIHEVIRAKNEELPEDRRMLFRIGVNLGDVIQEGDRIYGDGVNIAARLEGLAEPGGVCISGSAYEQIENKLALGYEYLGEHTVKNIAKPVKVYKVPVGPKAVTPKEGDEKRTKIKNWQWTAFGATGVIIIIIGALAIWNIYFRGRLIEPATVEPGQIHTAQEIEGAPKTIAVLPFENISSDPEQDYFSDGLTEELINKLSKVNDLQVTARTSSFYFKGINEDMRTIAEKLGVAYLLEGSVRKSREQLRITAQLIQAESGYHLWSETYERKLKDIFNIQDDISKSVTTALSVTLGVGEFNRPGMTRNIEAYDQYLRADANANTLDLHPLLAAIDLFKHALDIDPGFGLAWLGLSNAYLNAIVFLPPGEKDDFKEMAAQALKHARSIAPDMTELLRATAYEYYENGNLLEADRIYRQLLDMQGHFNSDANRAYGQMLMRVGRTSDAVPYLQRAKHLNPLDPYIYVNLSIALFNSKRIDEALAEAKRGQTIGGPDFDHIITPFLVALENNDRARAVAFLTPDENMTSEDSLVKILLMKDKITALSELKELSKASDIPPVGRLTIAHVASSLGDPELAFENFMKSGVFETSGAIWHPIHRAIWHLPAFKTYVHEIGMYDYWRTTGKWGDSCSPVGDDDFECN